MCGEIQLADNMSLQATHPYALLWSVHPVGRSERIFHWPQDVSPSSRRTASPQNPRLDQGKESHFDESIPPATRRYFDATLRAAFILVLILRIRALLAEPSPTTSWLSLTYSSLTRPITGGLAPQINRNAPPYLLDEYEYSIVLKSGHTVEKHEQAVGRVAEIDAVTKEVLYHPLPGFQVTYFARIVDYVLLDAIRADPGMEFVECDVVEEVDLALS